MANTVFAEHNQVKWTGIRPGITGEPINISGFVYGAGMAIVYTVPADKMLIMFNDWVTSQPANVAGLTHTWGIYDAVPALVYRLQHTQNLGAVAIFAISKERFVPLEIAAGYSIRITVAGGGAMSGGIEGILIDA